MSTDIVRSEDPFIMGQWSHLRKYVDLVEFYSTCLRLIPYELACAIPDKGIDSLRSHKVDSDFTACELCRNDRWWISEKVEQVIEVNTEVLK